MRWVQRALKTTSAGALAFLIAWIPMLASGAPVNANRAAAALVQAGDPVLGNPHGTVTIVDFYDIRCSPCRAVNLEIAKLLKADHFVRYVPVDYPLLGAPSVIGAKALFGAELQGKYGALHAILMRQTEPPDPAVIRQDAKAVGLDWPRLELDMDGDRVAAHLAANMRRGRALGIQGIPVLFIGSERIDGFVSYQRLRALVAQAEKGAQRRERS